LIRGNPGKRAIRPEPEPEIAPEVPEAPEYLTSYAADEWYRVAPELHRLGLLTLVDTHPLAAYCESYAMWRTAIEKLKEMAARDPITAGLLVKSQNGNAMQNPIILTMRQAAKDMVRYAGEFGLTPVARARIASAGYEPPRPPSKFDGLLA
jgi:P27 family predicted phage terminase small subunit